MGIGDVITSVGSSINRRLIAKDCINTKIDSLFLQKTMYYGRHRLI